VATRGCRHQGCHPQCDVGGRCRGARKASCPPMHAGRRSGVAAWWSGLRREATQARGDGTRGTGGVHVGLATRDELPRAVRRGSPAHQRSSARPCPTACATSRCGGSSSGPRYPHAGCERTRRVAPQHPAPRGPPPSPDWRQQRRPNDPTTHTTWLRVSEPPGQRRLLTRWRGAGETCVWEGAAENVLWAMRAAWQSTPVGSPRA
jgi:hypothetical protein